MSHQKTKETYSKIDNSYGDDSNQMLYERINFNLKKNSKYKTSQSCIFFQEHKS